MRRLYLSIVIMALTSLFFLGWMLDQFEAADDSQVKQTEYALYFQLMEGFAQQSATLTLSQLQLKVPEWHRAFNLPLSMHHVDELALPQELQPQLLAPGGLLLESDSRPYLVKSLASHPQYQLYLDLPEADNASPLDLWLTLAFYLGAGLLMALWLFPLTRRLSLIHKMATEFGKGQLDSRIPASRFSYIHWLEESFNRMAQQIEALIAENRMLASGLSHDLRTPLACLRFGVEAALDAEEAKEKDLVLLRMERDLEQMEQMVSAFLDYSSLDKRKGKLAIKQQRIDSLLIDIQRQAQMLAKQQGKDIRFIIKTQQQLVYADKVWLSRALLNILSNGVRFAKHQLELRVTVEEGYWVIEVEDDGPGIPPEKWQSVFKPFVRLEASRSREQGNYGLGLAIAHKVALWHQGDIQLMVPTHLTGCCFRLRLKLTE
ncbi:two-component sensor histidine kinase [Motilimonas cestriensis]|uniref:histidine kinase n=1 Tax=Motilimonas cestriensis TaxID=2742685 RepID=A0ABS8W8C8_9GAMM|nr:ATP-binding protein [Motilimonas cestriensis]MCE2594473.1 two-component sensor histidine kinase [Motilimonas cestriensis]